jgi:hypothetical protein
MASNTNASEKRRARRHTNMGRRRKNTTGRKSTQSMAELFAGFGEPGQPAPGLAAAAKK